MRARRRTSDAPPGEQPINNAVPEASFPACIAIPLGGADNQVTHIRVETWHLGDGGRQWRHVRLYAVLDMSPTTLAELDEGDFIRSIAATRGGHLGAP